MMHKGNNKTNEYVLEADGGYKRPYRKRIGIHIYDNDLICWFLYLTQRQYLNLIDKKVGIYE